MTSDPGEYLHEEVVRNHFIFFFLVHVQDAKQTCTKYEIITKL